MKTCCYWSSASCLCCWQTSTRSSEHDRSVQNKQTENRWVYSEFSWTIHKVSGFYKTRQHELFQMIRELGEVLDFWLCWREPDWSTVWVQIRSRFVVQFMTRKTSCVIWRQTQNFSMIHGDRMIADWLFFFSFCVKACFCKSDVKNQFNLCWRTERWNRTVVLLIFSPVYKVQYIYCFLSLLDSS